MILKGGPLVCRPWLWLPAKTSHNMSPLFLRLYGALRPFQTLTWKPFTWRGLEFTNPLGLAGGVDKNGDHIQNWWALGPGFIEVGTLTRRPQSVNSGKVLDRDNTSESLWNHMGFPNKGVDHGVGRMKNLYQPHFSPIFVNIGKNRDTPMEQAHEDYIYCMKKMAHYADAFVINISSPNSPGLRDLLKSENLLNFLKPIVEANGGAENLKEGSSSLNFQKPLLLKVSPDLSQEELHQVLEASLEARVDGWILTNTTSLRNSGSPFPKKGGVSGRELSSLSKQCLKQTVDFLGERRKGKLLVSVGGVMTPTDVLERLNMGADLVQVYSALAFSGPFFFRQVAEYVDLKGW